MSHREALLAALEATKAARRDYVTELDGAQVAQLSPAAAPTESLDGEPEEQPRTSEELMQTLAALVRQLDAAARELADAIRTIDQRERVSAKLR